MSHTISTYLYMSADGAYTSTLFFCILTYNFTCNAINIMVYAKVYADAIFMNYLIFYYESGWPISNWRFESIFHDFKTRPMLYFLDFAYFYDLILWVSVLLLFVDGLYGFYGDNLNI